MAQAHRILVTGSTGLLGNKLVALLAARDDVQVVASSRDGGNPTFPSVPFCHLDVVQPSSIHSALDLARPDVVIHTAAMTDVDGCERDPETCWRVNALGTEHLARACGERGIRLVHLSTEYVFDGQAGPYSEDDPASPICEYGRSKLAGEQAVQRYCASWAVARTTILYGFAHGGRSNFVLWLIGQLQAGREVRVVSDQIGSPTLADNLAAMLAAIGLSERNEVFNTVGASVIDRYSFALLVAEAFGLAAHLIRPITTAELRQAAPRPLRAGLKMDRFQQTFPTVPVLTAQSGLEELKRQLSL